MNPTVPSRATVVRGRRWKGRVNRLGDVSGSLSIYTVRD